MITTTSHNGRNWNIWQEVICNGRAGTISALFAGDMAGMAEVRLDRGVVCVGLSQLAKENPET